MRFAQLELAKPILDAVAREGYDTPTPIQARCIPPALAGRDVLGCAQTGTGKTAAFALPILQRLHTTNRKVNGKGGRVPPRALILSPTRELADQIAESFAVYGSNTRIRGTVVYGGVSQHRQVRALERGVDVLVATPGRLLDLMDQGYIDLRAIEVFVLDEADRMLDMGFINPIRRIAGSMPAKRQTMLFSATMPRAIEQLADSLLINPEKVSVDPVASAAPLIEQSVIMVDGAHKPALLRGLLDDPGVRRAVVFTRTKHGAEKLAKTLGKSGVAAESIHGNKSQSQRTRALDSFRAGRSRVLVATDVAARGLDVDGITHVINFNLPNEPEAYVHRIGRTGRAGAAGVALSFCDRDERAYLRAIEKLTGTKVPPMPIPEGLSIPQPSGHDPAPAPAAKPAPRNARPRWSGPARNRARGSGAGRRARA
ncbi:MAG: DEAD/DEAH box helicase [Phycisphaeraceae bacterium]|nr:MAG: DEAD/DEAH box helicase [Phycisphaeraceae bacterium]